MKIAIISNQNGVGKTTAGEYFLKSMHYEEVLDDNHPANISDELINIYSNIHQLDAVDVLQVKPAIRHELWLIGRALELHNPLLLIERCLIKTPVVCGIRTRDEYDAAKEAKLFDYWVWIESPDDRFGTSRDSYSELTKWDANVLIANNGTLEEFYKLCILHYESMVRKQGE